MLNLRNIIEDGNPADRLEYTELLDELINMYKDYKLKIKSRLYMYIL